MNRRNFMTGLGAAAATLVGAACAQTPAAARLTGQAAAAPVAPPPAAPVVPHTGDASHTTAMAADPQLVALAKSHEMDKHHEDGLKAFPARTATHGNQRLEPRIV